MLARKYQYNFQGFPNGHITMMNLNVKVVGLEKVGVTLLAHSTRIHKALKEEVTIIGFELERDVKANYLSGQYLRVKTGRLRNSIKSKVTANSTEIRAIVGTNVKYGRFHHEGFIGTESIREHLRKTSGGSTSVRAHTRRVTARARPFLGDALNSMRDQIRKRILGIVGG